MIKNDNPYTPSMLPREVDAKGAPPVQRQSPFSYLLSAIFGSVFVGIFGYSSFLRYARAYDVFAIAELMVALLLLAGFSGLVIIKLWQFVASLFPQS